MGRIIDVDLEYSKVLFIDIKIYKSDLLVKVHRNLSFECKGKRVGCGTAHSGQEKIREYFETCEHLNNEESNEV